MKALLVALGFGVKALYTTVVKVDSQDNLVKYLGVGEQEDWTTNYNWDDLNFFKDYGARRTGDGVILFVKNAHLKKGLEVKLLNFPYRYKIKQVSNEQFLVTSKHLEEYFNHTDMIYYEVRQEVEDGHIY